MPLPPTVRQRLALAAAGLGLLLAPAARAQRPDAHWRTLVTPHFRVHFAPEGEAVARHAAVSAEWAWTALARELVPPRGPVELVVSDDADFSNGYTTTFPTNRVVVYTQPPVDVAELRNYDDWITLVVTHELTHVFHLDRSRGIWWVMQHVLGRNPYVFPAAYEPRWVSEGLAVYYESRVTGAGRIVSGGHRAIARAAALGGGGPRVGDLSVTRSAFPGGENVYIYGSLIFDELARTHGPESIRRYVEYSSAYLLPFQLTRTSRAAFGESFNRALRAVNDSARAALRPHQDPLARWRPLATGFDALVAPRLDGDGILFGAARGKEMPGAYRVDTTGLLRRLGRRTDAVPNVRLRDGSLLTAQLEFVSPWEIRSDLYVQRGRRLRRLTRGQRLAAPDARADGEIVAVQSLPGTTALVRVSRDGRTVRRITPAALDTQWAQPRWSLDGRAIAAVRLLRGDTSQIVVLDSTGARVAVVAEEHGAVSASPAWTADGRWILFTSDRSGSAEVYAAYAPGAAAGDSIFRLSSTNTALADPLDLSFRGDDRRSAGTIAAAELRADGWALGIGGAGVTAIDEARQPTAPSGDSHDTAGRRPVLPAGSDSSRSHAYHAFRQLLPRYWMPVVYTTDLSTTVLGAVTSGSDVVGRHAWSASAELAPRWDERGGSVAYQWAGLGMPVLDAAASQEWDGAGTIYQTDSGSILGVVRRRTRTVSGGLSWTRPRTRNVVALQAAGGVESRDYAARPDSLAAAIATGFFSRTHRRPFLLGAVAAANTQSPRRSISREDGLSAFASAQRLWDRDERAGGHTRTVGSLAGYRALDLPGYAHHVIALRVSAGWSDSEDPREFTVGGTESDLAALGVAATGDASDFPIRGFMAGALAGTRALTASLEYRAPLGIPARGFTVLFLDRTSLSLFADAATAWCGADAKAIGCTTGTRPGTPLASIGGELVFDVAIFYDAPLTARLGAAKSLGRFAGSTRASEGVYVAIGRSF